MAGGNTSDDAQNPTSGVAPKRGSGAVHSGESNTIQKPLTSAVSFSHPIITGPPPQSNMGPPNTRPRPPGSPARTTGERPTPLQPLPQPPGPEPDVLRYSGGKLPTSSGGHAASTLARVSDYYGRHHMDSLSRGAREHLRSAQKRVPNGNAQRHLASSPGRSKSTPRPHGDVRHVDYPTGVFPRKDRRDSPDPGHVNLTNGNKDAEPIQDMGDLVGLGHDLLPNRQPHTLDSPSSKGNLLPGSRGRPGTGRPLDEDSEAFPGDLVDPWLTLFQYSNFSPRIHPEDAELTCSRVRVFLPLRELFQFTTMLSGDVIYGDHMMKEMVTATERLADAYEQDCLDVADQPQNRDIFKRQLDLANVWRKWSSQCQDRAKSAWLLLTTAYMPVIHYKAYNSSKVFLVRKRDHNERCLIGVLDRYAEGCGVMRVLQVRDSFRPDPNIPYAMVLQAVRLMERHWETRQFYPATSGFAGAYPDRTWYLEQFPDIQADMWNSHISWTYFYKALPIPPPDRPKADRANGEARPSPGPSEGSASPTTTTTPASA